MALAGSEANRAGRGMLITIGVPWPRAHASQSVAEPYATDPGLNLRCGRARATSSAQDACNHSWPVCLSNPRAGSESNGDASGIACCGGQGRGSKRTILCPACSEKCLRPSRHCRWAAHSPALKAACPAPTTEAAYARRRPTRTLLRRLVRRRRGAGVISYRPACALTRLAVLGLAQSHDGE